MVERFLRIKELLGLKTTQVLRYIINEYWRKVIEKGNGK